MPFSRAQRRNDVHTGASGELSVRDWVSRACQHWSLAGQLLRLARRLKVRALFTLRLAWTQI